MPYNEDRGIDIRLQTKINLAGASAVQGKVKKPDATTATWTMTIYDEANGILRYITSTVTNELGIIGKWQIEPRVVFATGEVYNGAIGEFTVAEVLFPTI